MYRKNNPYKFPERFSWISTSSLNEHGGRRYTPRAFTEQGIVKESLIDYILKVITNKK